MKSEFQFYSDTAILTQDTAILTHLHVFYGYPLAKI